MHFVSIEWLDIGEPFDISINAHLAVSFADELLKELLVVTFASLYKGGQ